MTIQDLGSIGELIAAIATIATLVYLAIQVRQNTRALKASTFQSIASEMGQNVLPILMTPDMAPIFAKSTVEGAELTEAERLRLHAQYIASFRRLESVFVQVQLGSIDPEYAEGFELSLISLMRTPAGAEWWKSAKPVFLKEFVTHVDERLSSGDIPEGNPAIQPNQRSAT